MYRIISAMLLYLAACVMLQDVRAQSTDLVAPGGSLKKVSDQFDFTEGPAVDPKGNVYFTDQPNNRIWKYDTRGQLSLFMSHAGRSNGTYINHQGNLITCADENNELWSISSDKKVRVLLSNFRGHRLNGPNDLWIDAKGGIYFTDPYFQRDYWKRTHPDSLLGGERLYYLPAGGKAAMVADSDLIKPNGVVGTPDGKYLYVAEMGKSVIYRYQIDGPGWLSHRAVFIHDLADGLTLDNKGNIYLAGMGVTVYDRNGKKIAHFDVPEKWTANLCFGGSNKNQLFITASKSIYILPMRVRGVE